MAVAQAGEDCFGFRSRNDMQQKDMLLFSYHSAGPVLAVTAADAAEQLITGMSRRQTHLGANLYADQLLPQSGMLLDGVFIPSGN